jgi:hypothetical protein
MAPGFVSSPMASLEEKVSQQALRGRLLVPRGYEIVDFSNDGFIQRQRFMGRENLQHLLSETVKHGLAPFPIPFAVSASVNEARVPEVAQVCPRVGLLQKCSTWAYSFDHLYSQGVLINVNVLEKTSDEFNHLIAQDDALTRGSHAGFEIAHVVK